MVGGEQHALAVGEDLAQRAAKAGQVDRVTAKLATPGDELGFQLAGLGEQLGVLALHALPFAGPLERARYCESQVTIALGRCLRAPRLSEAEPLPPARRVVA